MKLTEARRIISEMLPPGFLGFDEPEQSPPKQDRDSAALRGVRRGDILRVGRTQWVAARDAHSFIIPLVYKHGTSFKKMYELTMTGRGEGAAEVWLIGGSSQRLSGTPVASGKVSVVGHQEMR